jgi:hypothetical protein
MVTARAMKWGRMLLLAAAVTLLGGQHELRGAGARVTAARPQEGPVRICRWYGGKTAALSLRFDDSHPTHLTRAIPALNERGLVGTFLVNPGQSSFADHRAEWEAVVRQGHELDDHTMNHSGAQTDAEAEWEVGEAARIIREMQPELRMPVFSRGGATYWLQRKPMAFLTAKYHLFSPGSAGHRRSSMSCSTDYDWFSPAVFTSALDEAIHNHDWMQAHFHCIGEGYLVITEAAFAEVLDAAQARRASLWNAGLSAIGQYDVERDAAVVSAEAQGSDAVAVHLACATDPAFYQQPLTLEFDLPSGLQIAVRDANGKILATHAEEGRVRFDVPPVDADYRIEGPGVAAALAAPGAMPPPGPHPYLFFFRPDADGLLAKTADPTAKAMWEAIERRARWLAAEPREERTGVRARASVARPLLFHYALTHDPAEAPAVARSVEALLNDDSWHSDHSEMLITAAATCTLGLAYDWAYDALSDDQRARVRRTIVEQGIDPVLEQTAAGEWWTHWPRGNWGAVIYGQVGVAALSLLSDEPQAAEWVRLCQRKVWHYTQSLGRDGGWGESGTYALYLWSNALMFMDALRHVTGADLFDNPRLRAQPAWFINLLEPDGDKFVPFSNCGPWTEGKTSILYREAREYGDGYAQGVANAAVARRAPADIFAFLWYDPAVEAKPLTDWPCVKVFSSIDWAMMRSGWDDPQATLFALKGGQKDWDHYHHDTNSFVLYARGRPLLVDLMYPHDIWGCRTEAHNTIMVNGEDQRGEVHVAGMRGNPDYRGVIAGLLGAPWYARLVGDASLAYDQSEVKSFLREVMYLRHAEDSDPPEYFVLFDDVEATAPATMDWLLHTYGQIAVDGNVLHITQDDAAVDVTVVAPSSFTHELAAKNLEEIKVPKPFESADEVRYIKVRPAAPAAQGRFLSVLVPRAASAPPAVRASAVSGPGLVGTAVTWGPVQDVALFALDAPKIAAQGVEAEGRSVFVRRSGGRVTAAAVHGCRRLTVDGTLLFAPEGSGDAALRFGENAVEATLSLYDTNSVQIHVGRKPRRVVVNGREAEFTYEAETKCVRLPARGARDVRIELE